MLSRKSFIQAILELFPFCIIIPIILDWLETAAAETETQLDDHAVSALRVAFRFTFPSCFPERRKNS